MKKVVAAFVSPCSLRNNCPCTSKCSTQTKLFNNAKFVSASFSIDSTHLESKFAKRDFSSFSDKSFSRKNYIPTDKITIGTGPSLTHLKVKYPNGHCWSCSHLGNPSNTLFCNSCEKIQPTPEEFNNFQLFSLPISYKIDTAGLEKQYLKLQRAVHPDKFQTKSQTEQSISNLNSSRINEAYKILKDPNERALYILKLKGIDFEQTMIDDPELLTEVLETRELLEDSQLSVKQLRSMLASNEEKLQSMYSNVGDSIEKEDYEGAKKQLSKIQYLLSLSKEIKAQLPVT